MKNSLKVISLALFMFSNGALAECSGNNCSNVKITRMFITATGHTSVTTSGDESQLNCDVDSGNYITLRNTHPGYDAIYSLILAAHTTEHPITLGTVDSGSCDLSYVVSDR